MISEALSFWNAISGKVNRLIKDETNNAFRCERYTVTTAANGSKIGVTLPYGNNEVFLPYSREVADATVGTPVLVVWWGSMSNAKVYYFADGYNGYQGSSGTPLDSYPVGAIYKSFVSTSPAQLFGGTWERIEDAFLLAAGETYAAGSTGGEAAVTLTADQSGQRSHYHGSGQTGAGLNTNFVRVVTGATIERKTVKNGTSTSQSGIVTSTQAFGPVTNTASVSALDAAEAHNNMPPYLAVYVWKRIA